MALTLVTTRFPMDAFEDTVRGTYDGNNTVFTLMKSPVNGTLRLFQSPDGLSLREGVDYTLSGMTITLGAAPVSSGSGGNLQATYQTNG